MARTTVVYKGELYLAESEVFFLLMIADSLDEIGAQSQCEIIRKITSMMTRVTSNETQQI